MARSAISADYLLCFRVNGPGAAFVAVAVQEYTCNTWHGTVGERVSLCENTRFIKFDTKIELVCVSFHERN